MPSLVSMAVPLATTDDLADSIAALRPRLLHLARLQLRNAADAEDVVQECLASAMASGQKFEGRAALATWLIAILRNKIVDCIRQHMRAREHLVEDLGDDVEAELFKPDGHWVEPPANWGNPEQALASKHFFAALEACVESLPQRHAQVFMLRETMGMETQEICQQLGISATNCAAMLSRARMRLRECLQLNWFGNSR